jgi:hypothetical protein
MDDFIKLLILGIIIIAGGVFVFKHTKIGKQLAMRISGTAQEKIIQDAKGIGYSQILLDTLPFLESAIRMYRSFGFYEIESYNNSPMDTSIYMRLDVK